MVMDQFARKLKGVIAPVLTPFQSDRSVDYVAWERLVAWLIEHKVDALFVGGGSGEWPHLTPEERVELARRAAGVASGAVPVLAGSLGRSFEETVTLSRRMAEAGADFLAVVIPRFVGPGEPVAFSSLEGETDFLEYVVPDFSSPLEEPICAFFRRLVEAFPYPTMLYDPPGSGEYGLQPVWLRRLAALDPVVGLKKSTRDLQVFIRLMDAAGEGFAMIAGDETVMLPCLAVGAAGCIGGGANMFPELMRTVQDAFDGGEMELARAAQLELDRINRLIERCGWPLSGKIALGARGLAIEPVTRCKAAPIRSDDHSRLVAYFQQERYRL